MKTIRSLGTLAAVLLLVGCSSTDTATTASSPGVTAEPGKRTYSSDRLRSTGEDNVGDQLAKTDPTVSITRR